jgi:hypothetical protein
MGEQMAIRGHALALAATFVIAPAAVATQASAATISVNKPCFVTGAKRAPMTVTGSGFIAGDTVTLSSSDGSVAASGPVSATGTISITTGAPVPGKLFDAAKPKTVSVTATDLSATAPVSASTPTTVVPLLVQTKPARAKFTRRVTFFFSGFTQGETIYAHFLHPKQVALARYGKAKGVCGLLTTRARLYPGGHPHFKSYKVQFDDFKHFSKKAAPRLDVTLRTFVVR